MWRPLFHVFTLLLTVLVVSQAMDMDKYRQIVALSLQPRGDPVANENIKNAIIELVVAHFNEVRGVPYSIGSATGLLNAGKRRKRFSGFGNNWGSSFGFDPWLDPWSNNNRYNNQPSNNNNNNNNRYGGGGNSHHTHQPSNSYGGFNSRPNIIHCPVQVNQSAVYQLNPTGTGYPATDIGNELFARSLPGSDLFFQCLLRAAVIPGQPPTVTVDQNFVTANHTCPNQSLTLFSYAYQNAAFGGRCWLVQGFQEPIEFSVCQTKSCVNCKLTDNDKQSGYPQFNSNGYNNQHQPASRNVTVNQCITEYRTAQVISYCENLPINMRIIYDRIIVPLFCSCKSIDCSRAASRW